MALSAREIATSILKALGGRVAEIKSATDARIEALEARVAVLDGKTRATPESEYKAGDVIERAGARWLCRGMGRWRRIEDDAA